MIPNNTRWYPIIPDDTQQYLITPQHTYNTQQHIMIPNNILWSPTIPDDTQQYQIIPTIPNDTKLYHMIPNNALLYPTIPDDTQWNFTIPNNAWCYQRICYDSNNTRQYQPFQMILNYPKWYPTVHDTQLHMMIPNATFYTQQCMMIPTIPDNTFVLLKWIFWELICLW